MEGGGLQDFLRHQGDDKDNDKNGISGNVMGPKIAVGCAALTAREGDAPSAAASSIGAASLGVQFCPTQRTLDELIWGEVIACKQDRGPKGSKT